MKKLFILLLCSASLTMALAQEQPPYMTKNIGANINMAEVSTSGGFISVMHEAGQANRVEVYIRGNNDKQLSQSEIAQRLQADYELTVETSGNKVIARAKRKSKDNNWKNGLSISFKIYMAEKADTKLATSGGSISLSGLNGNHDFATSGGSIKVSRMKGDIEGATSGGSISIDNTQADVELVTSGGSITASDCKGDLELKTSGGSLKLTNLDGEIEAATSGGSVEGHNISGELEVATSGGSMRLTAMKCTLDAVTSAGTMKVEMASLGKYVRLRNSAGSIQLTVPGNKGMNLDLKGDEIELKDLHNFSGSHTSKEVKGSLNGGGVEVSARTSGGRVSLDFGKQYQ